MATREEIQTLKDEWRRDPIFDLYDVEGFEDHREELKAYQDFFKMVWPEKKEKEEKELKAEAERIGLSGLYKIILKQENELQELRDRLARAGL